jgi:hypothetical protein
MLYGFYVAATSTLFGTSPRIPPAIVPLMDEQMKLAIFLRFLLLHASVVGAGRDCENTIAELPLLVGMETHF